jgi:hypothetical protein
MASPWSPTEITHTLHHYFQMLDLEISGKAYSKAEFRRKLQPLLDQRSKGAIEFKHQNISAVLQKHGMPYIIGYKPMSNFQALLEKLVLEYVQKKSELDQLFIRFAEPENLILPERVNYASLMEMPPEPTVVNEAAPFYTPELRKPNFLKIEQQNRKLGLLGEELILQYEKWRLIQVGKEKLADRIEWISRDVGDGAGFDILSKNENGTDRYIEVKTTQLSESTPFYFTRNELQVSWEKADAYHLYRLYRFRHKPRFFTKQGSFDRICRYEAVSFEGRV